MGAVSIQGILSLQTARRLSLMATDIETNPYSAPASAGTQIVGVDFTPIIRRWERLRIYYNTILVSFVLLVTFVAFPGKVSDVSYWASVTVGGVIANLLFLTGPAIEGYGTHFRIWHRFMTILLFLAGLGFSTFLAIGAIAALTGTL